MRTLSIFSYSLSGTPRACTGGFAMPCLLERSSMSFLKLSMSFRAKSRNLRCFGYAQHDKGAACNMTGFLSFRAKSRNLGCFGCAQHDGGYIQHDRGLQHDKLSEKFFFFLLQTKTFYVKMKQTENYIFCGGKYHEEND